MQSKLHSTNDSKSASCRFSSCERGAVHIIGGLFVLFSVYTTWRIFAEGYMLSNEVQAQQKRMEMLELKLQILEYRASAR